MDFLRTIVDHKRAELAERKKRVPPAALRDPPEWPPRDFAAALRDPPLAAIAEIKRRSPSRGTLRADLNPARIARAYEANGAAAISVLTDRKFFGGGLEDLSDARQAVALPVLRKDFVVDAYQIHEARHSGADAVLLIVRILSAAQLADYLALARELGLAALVEVHDESELARAVEHGAETVGVNNRDLETFDVSLDTAVRLRRLIPVGCVAVAESGIHTRQDVRRLEQAGYDAMLVGASLVTAADPGAKLRELLGDPP